MYAIFTVSRNAGDPVAGYVTPETPPQIVEAIREKYHLNDPIPTQFIYYVRGVLRGDLGRAPSYGYMPITEIFWQFLPYTLELNLYSLLITLPTSYWIGTKAATNRDSIFDHIARLAAILGRSLPGFFTGLLLLAFLYPRGWLLIDPRFQFTRITGLPTIDAILNWDMDGLVRAIKYLIGPLITSFITGFANNTRILRSSILEELGKDYTLTGRSKGLSKDYVDKRYARRNALIPFLTMLGLWLAGLFSGSAIMEIVFNRAGLGSVYMGAVRVSDHNAIQAMTGIYTLMLLSANFVVDLVYGFIDPRIRYGERK
jgi:peptide/nickel transport system permease protein